MNIEEIEANLHKFPAEQGAIISQILRISVHNTAMIEALIHMMIMQMFPESDKNEIDEIFKETMEDANVRFAQIFSDIFQRLSKE